MYPFQFVLSINYFVQRFPLIDDFATDHDASGIIMAEDFATVGYAKAIPSTKNIQINLTSPTTGHAAAFFTLTIKTKQ